jgi:hypothetical protein
MPKRNPFGYQADTIKRPSPFTQLTLDLNKQDHFVKSFAVDFTHFKTMPSPIGKKDKGDYRRSDGVDTITSNGMLYRLGGVFRATMTDDSREKKRTGGGFLDFAEARLVLPRFYNKPGDPEDSPKGDRIYLAPGDRLYISDPDADVLVANYQEINYEEGVDNQALYPIVKIEFITDSRNIDYKEGFDFCITKEGNIRWHEGKGNPGIDPDTGRGRPYAVRYLYKAFWYVVSLPKEIRVTNITVDGVRKPERMPYYATIVREFVYHNQNRGDQKNQNQTKTPGRAQPAPTEPINPAKPVIPVDMSTILDGKTITVEGDDE